MIIKLISGWSVVNASIYSDITVKIRKLGSTSLLKSLSLDDGLSVISPASSGEILFSLQSTDTASVKAGAYECEMVATRTGETDRTVIYAFILKEPYE